MSRGINTIKKTYSNIERIFVTPYLNENYNKLKYNKDYYDCCIYPPIEKSPYKFAIEKRNKWMVDNCDFLVCYITRTYGGAYKTFKYANKRIKHINIAEI